MVDNVLKFGACVARYARSRAPQNCVGRHHLLDRRLRCCFGNNFAFVCDAWDPCGLHLRGNDGEGDGGEGAVKKVDFKYNSPLVTVYLGAPGEPLTLLR